VKEKSEKKSRIFWREKFATEKFLEEREKKRTRKKKE
jgi:hypothetical protein